MAKRPERKEHRSIVERVVVRGTLVLESPAHFGGGEPDALTDMPVLLDEVDQKPLLPGTSIAGALRNYLREVQAGDSVEVPTNKESAEFKIEKERAATLLFGGFRGDDDGEQSPLVVEDSIGKLSDYELRDGVSINAETRTAKDDQKFDIQLLGAGTKFPLQFELAIREGERDVLLTALATALKGFEEGAITLGARKRRGFGKCNVRGWELSFYDLKNKKGLFDWLSSERGWTEASASVKQPIQEALKVTSLHTDIRKRATLKATFGLDGTLLIRSGFGDLDARADTVHLRAVRTNGKDPVSVPVIPATSWGGILRHRALKIARTVASYERNPDSKAAFQFVEDLFGPSEIKENEEKSAKKLPVKASRISIEESEVKDAESLEITRVAIDRFTGGAYEGALFTEQPLVGNKASEVELVLTLRNPIPSEVGLLLLLLKDLWTGDLPIGGESGIGRGRLYGRTASLSFENDTWEIEEKPDGRLQVTSQTSNQEKLEEFVRTFNKQMGGAK